eukprot:CAMPEP_0174251852 /NCGR_PEP_ID=MMETSP0439-20130205/1551_1 /TAXON_ID=0 /ORGANISM="Stereomyxa ramosa, Strain Chinc5" /LENGTH=161 /DNA_ID=CAMNT_0015332285 /DNA_START=51 /DNA_END=536 /DNA_ORIENTATION=+
MVSSLWVVLFVLILPVLTTGWRSKEEVPDRMSEQPPTRERSRRYRDDIMRNMGRQDDRPLRERFTDTFERNKEKRWEERRRRRDLLFSSEGSETGTDVLANEDTAAKLKQAVEMRWKNWLERKDRLGDLGTHTEQELPPFDLQKHLALFSQSAQLRRPGLQ